MISFSFKEHLGNGLKLVTILKKLNYEENLEIILELFDALQLMEIMEQLFSKLQILKNQEKHLKKT